MPEVNENYYQQPYMYQAPYAQPNQQMPPQYNYGYQQMPMQQQKSVRDEFVSQHRKNGLFERLYNGIKNLTGLGVGSKKAKSAVVKAENGEISEEQARETITKYRSSQANSAQLLGDAVSIAVSAGTFFGLRNEAKKLHATKELNKKFGSKKPNWAELMEKGGGFNLKTAKNVTSMILANSAKSKTKLAVTTTVIASLAGGIAKLWTGRINRIGSSEFKTDKKKYNNLQTEYDNAAYKIEKKMHRSKKRKDNFRNFLSGTINGLMMPLTILGGAIAGVPLYLAGNSLNRYFVGNTEDKNKSFGGYLNNLKGDLVGHAALAAGIAIPLVKKGRFTAEFDKNLKKAFDSINAQSALKDNAYGGKTAYQQINEILLDSPNVKEIMHGKLRIHELFTKPSEDAKIIDLKGKVDKLPKEIRDLIKEKYGNDTEILKAAKEEYNNEPKLLIKTSEGEEKWLDLWRSHDDKLTIDDQITALTKENIFAVKALQIMSGGGSLSKALQEGCPPTRTLDKAAKFIEEKLGSGYKIKANMGTGTVAETYLAEKDGKEVCIKILKTGIDAEKIATDKKKFIDLINSLDKPDAEKKYLIKNVEDWAEGLAKEVDLENEMKAAEKLVNYTKSAKVVKPIEVKNGVYVMEKADGISFKKLLEINNMENMIRYYERQLEKGVCKERDKSFYQRQLDKLKEEKEELVSKYSDLKLSEEDFDYMIDQYMKVLVEQLYKTDKAGRTLHADIHPGNIFVDVNAIKTRKGKAFTLIDTGNTIDLTADQAMHSMKLTQYIERGDTKDIANYFIEEADLSASGLTKEQAAQKLEEKLNQVFFDSETRLPIMNNTQVINLTSNMMREMGVMPGNSQLNLEKARQSASESFNALLEMWGNEAGNNIQQQSGMSKITTAIGKLNKAMKKMNEYQELQKAQEKRNMLKMFSLTEKKNPNYKDKNSVEYLTYHLKQGITPKEASMDEMFGM